MRSTKMIVFALLNETGGCFLDPGLGLLVEHPLDQLPKGVGIEGLPQDGHSRTAGKDVQVAGRYSRSHEDYTRSQVRPRLRHFLLQRLTVHLGHMKVRQDEGQASFRKQREGFVPVPS